MIFFSSTGLFLEQFAPSRPMLVLPVSVHCSTALYKRPCSEPPTMMGMMSVKELDCKDALAPLGMLLFLVTSGILVMLELAPPALVVAFMAGDCVVVFCAWT